MGLRAAHPPDCGCLPQGPWEHSFCSGGMDQLEPSASTAGGNGSPEPWPGLLPRAPCSWTSRAGDHLGLGGAPWEEGLTAVAEARGSACAPTSPGTPPDRCTRNLPGVVRAGGPSWLAPWPRGSPAATGWAGGQPPSSALAWMGSTALWPALQIQWSQGHTQIKGSLSCHVTRAKISCARETRAGGGTERPGHTARGRCGASLMQSHPRPLHTGGQSHESEEATGLWMAHSRHAWPPPAAVPCSARSVGLWAQGLYVQQEEGGLQVGPFLR